MEQLSSQDELTVGHQFDRLCQLALDSEAANYHKHLEYRGKHEVNFSDMSEAELNRLSVTDEYSLDHFCFQVLGYDVEVRDTVYKDGNALMELPVLAKAALNGDDMEIGNTANGFIEVGGDGAAFFFPYEIYKKLYDEPTVYKYSFNVKKDKQTEMISFLENYISTEATSIDYMSDDSARRGAEADRTMISFVGGLTGVIFGIIGVLNLVNTIITTIITRRLEFATMQSIGMTNRQLARMITYEGIYYASGACIFGLTVSLLLGFTVVRGLVNGIWYFSFQFTLVPALISCGILLVVSAVIPSIALYLFHKGSIVEKLRVRE